MPDGDEFHPMRRGMHSNKALPAWDRGVRAFFREEGTEGTEATKFDVAGSWQRATFVEALVMPDGDEFHPMRRGMHSYKALPAWKSRRPGIFHSEGTEGT